MALVLLAYVFTAFLVHIDWHRTLVSTLVPHLERSRQFAATLVALFGTTISPYLFFWQAAQEVEEQKALGRTDRKRGATPQEQRATRTDVVTGMFASNAVMYFIILTTAATLHESSHTGVTTAREAAEALRPLAGNGAYWLFTLGLIGTGMLAVPVLAGSCAYAIAEGASWRHASLAERPGSGRRFYFVLAMAMLIGLALTFLHVSAVKMLFVSAIINGVLAPPLVAIVVLLTSDRAVMGKGANTPLLRGLGWATFALMSVAALGLLM
jgi:Mn2+/Fe2+ NRAMP family transporter